MTPSTRGQKTQVAAAAPCRPAPSLDAFTRVSKSQGPQNRTPSKAITIRTDTTSDGKRKAANPQSTQEPVSFPLGVDDESSASPPSKRACLRLEAQLRSPGQAEPQAKDRRAVKRIAPRVPAGLDSSPSTLTAESRCQSGARPDKFGRAVPAKKTSKPTEHVSDELPPHLSDLVRLHRAFLRTVVVQIAHVSPNVPMDIRAMTPHISRAWGKRQVTVDDVCRCIAIESFSSAESTATSSPVVLPGYGLGKVCIELAAGRHGVSIDEDGLERQFLENLDAISAQRTVHEMAGVGRSLEQLSMADLPQAAVTDKSAGARGSAVMTKGHRALAHLKGGLEAKQQEKAARKQASASGSTPNPESIQMSLLDRIRLKQLLKEDEPLPPTVPDLRRCAALNRVADVAATISMLSLSTSLSLPRQAFSMAAISTKLIDSLRVPISKDEGKVCVRLMATEVAPEWLKLVTIGGREHLVVQRSGQPVDRVLYERVEKLLANVSATQPP